MSKDYIGTGYEGPTSYDVRVEQDGKRLNLTHKVHGADTDFQWDGSGPDSTALARALLRETTGVEPEWRVYRLFKAEVLANWPHHEGECWRISEEEIKVWLAGVERDTARTESADRTEARLEQMRDRESRLRGFARTQGRKP